MTEAHEIAGYLRGLLGARAAKLVVVGPGGPTAVVLAKIGGTAETCTGQEARREFKQIEGLALPLVAVPDLARVRAELLAEFPHATDAIAVLLSDLVGARWVKFRPTLLLGDAGAGKTRLVCRIGETLGLYIGRFDGSGSPTMRSAARLAAGAPGSLACR